MNRSLKLFVSAALLGAMLSGGVWAYRSYSTRHAWAEQRPTLPAPVSDNAPGLDQRLTACEARFRAWPPDQASLAEFAQLCHANGLLDSATTAYRALAVLQPNEPRWPHLLATIIAGDGRLEEALPLLRRTTELAPERVIAWLTLGDALLKSNHTDEATAAYSSALQRDSTNAYALLGLARCDLQAERWTAARAHLQQAVAQQPEFSSAQSLLASVLERLGNTEGAAIAKARSQRNGHYPDPPDAWRDALTEFCLDPYTLLVTASGAAAEGKPEQALVLIKRAIGLAPNDARLHRKLGNTLMQLGDPAGAREALEAAAALAPTNDAIQLNLIALLRRANDRAAVERTVARALENCPGSAGIHYEAGLLARDAANFAEAAQHFEFTWENQPDQPALGVTLAEMRFRANQNEAGLAALQEVISRNPAFEPAVILLVNHGIETADARTGSWLEHARHSGVSATVVASLERTYRDRAGTALR
jgi:tetratricopeptide (TPR) repeat protein